MVILLAPWETVGMKKPHMVIVEETNGLPVRGTCSACVDVFFSTGAPIGTIEAHQSKLDSLFREHFRNVHMREDASRATARVVRESTQDK
jgi:hypothetical protein